MTHRIIVHGDLGEVDPKAAKEFFIANNIPIQAECNTTIYPDMIQVSVYYVEGWNDNLEILLRAKTGCEIEATLHEIDAKTHELYKCICDVGKYVLPPATNYSYLSEQLCEWHEDANEILERNVRNDVNDDFFRRVYHSGDIDDVPYSRDDFAEEIESWGDPIGL